MKFSYLLMVIGVNAISVNRVHHHHHHKSMPSLLTQIEKVIDTEAIDGEEAE